ncbi:hypothetical protein PRIPAC_87492, partial [Pristionchus pacificus]
LVMRGHLSTLLYIRNTSLAAMNMALRPSSLLLLLVMIPAITSQLPEGWQYPDLKCHLAGWFCYPLDEYHEKLPFMERDTTAYKASDFNKEDQALSTGGIALDAHIDEFWIITFDFSFDHYWDKAAENKIFSNGAETIIHMENIKQNDQNIPKFGLRNGVKIVPWKWCSAWKIFMYKLEVGPGLYVADELGLFIDPVMKLGIVKNLQKVLANDGEARAVSRPFKPFECEINKDGAQPDAIAVKATQNENTFNCGAGQNIFLEGTNTHAELAYCGVGGWFGKDKTMILKRFREEKVAPYCTKDTIFEDCSKNKCFLFNPSEAPTDLIKVDDSNKLDKKFGAYVIFDSDTTWRLQLQYQHQNDLTSFTIGKETFNVSDGVVTGQPDSKVEATIVLEGPKLIPGYNGKIFKFEALKTESKKDLMWLFGFYSAGAVNKLHLDFGGKALEADGVANYDKYVQTSGYKFGGAGASPSSIDVNNLFECNGDLRIYLDNARTGLMKLRFTKSKWLDVDGSPARDFDKDASGKDIIPAVNCFTVCKEASITLAGNPKPIKNATSTPALEYTCLGEYVKVNNKVYPSVTCTNEQWSGGSEVIELSTTFTFSAECYGELKAPCSNAEKLLGCDEVIESSGVLTCKPGYALTIANSADDKIYASLTVSSNGHWLEDTKDHGTAESTHRAVCYSKCSKSNLDVKPPNTDSEMAEYNHVQTTNIGKLKCTSNNNLLVSIVEGVEKAYSVLTCDNDGWKEGNVVKKNFNAAKSVNDLKVKSRCYKVCDNVNIDTKCTAADSDNGCAEPTYASSKLTCLDTHVLFVNDKIADKPLICSDKGWTKDGESTLFIDNRAIDLTKKTTARCISKCGKKFVTVSTPLTLTANTIACPGTDMISYTVDSDPAKETLLDLTCDKDGWKGPDGTYLISFAPGSAKQIKAECKQGCNGDLVMDGCAGGSLGFCEKAKYNNDELQWSCSTTHVLWAENANKASPTPIKCEKLNFKSDTITIPRTSPTAKETISCFSICHEEFFEIPASETDKTLKTLEWNNGFTLKCKQDIHYYLGIGHGVTTNYFKEFKCDPNSPAPIITAHLGEKAKITCRNKCDNRIKVDSCTGEKDCVMPTLDASNKLTCDDAHVMRIKTSVETKYIFGNALECKADGFYENTEKLLSFKDDPNEDNEKFGIACISPCDSKLALSQGAEITKNSNPKRDGDVVQCQDVAGQILHVTYGEATIRVFGPATCDKDIGWTGVNAMERPRGTADGNIVKFAGHKAQFKTQCLKVCDGAMVKDIKDEKDKNDHPYCPAADLCASIKFNQQANGPTLECKDNNYRLVINDENNDNKPVTVTRAKTMACTNEGWTEGTEKVVDFKDPDEDLTKPVEAICKNKCHPHFIKFTNEEACPKETECSKPTYDPSSKTLKCSDNTEVLVLEYNGELKESFTEATCHLENGWSNGQELFKMDELNFRVKARCEQLCAFNVDKAALNDETETGLDYDRVAKMLTCNGTDEMLALNGVGVYSDLTCTKEGWITDPKIKDVDGNPMKKVEFKPIIASEADAAKAQRDERAKQFTCVPNDCLRAFKCKGHEYTKVGTDEDCINPDITKIKYEMSCTSPSKLTNKDQTLSYDTLRCSDGAWKSADQSTLIDKLNPDSDEINKPVSERPAFDVFCNALACTGCTVDDLTIIQSTTDANIAAYQFNDGSFTTCSHFKCGSGADYVVEGSGKNKYYRNTGSNPIKCSSTKQDVKKTFTAPDGRSNIGGKVGCVKQIPCNEHRPLQTDCQGLKSTCDSDAFQQRLKIGSLTSESEPVTCDTLGRMYYQKDAGKTGWKIVDKLLCTKTGEWNFTYYEVKDEKKEHVFGPETLSETMKLDSSKAETNPRVICAVQDPNPEAKIPDNDPKTATCTYCPFPPVLECNDGCKNAQEHATATNDGNGKCEMKIINGRFKINGGDEIDKGTVLTCQMIDGKYPWMTPDGKKIDSLAVIMKDSDNISTGAIAGIVIGVILVLGLIVFAMVYMAIRKRKEMERQEKLKNKGLEQKQDSIIDGATIVDDTKTLVL